MCVCVCEHACVRACVCLCLCICVRMLANLHACVCMNERVRDRDICHGSCVIAIVPPSNMQKSIIAHAKEPFDTHKRVLLHENTTHKRATVSV